MRFNAVGMMCVQELPMRTSREIQAALLTTPVSRLTNSNADIPESHRIVIQRRIFVRVLRTIYMQRLREFLKKSVQSESTYLF